MAFQLYSTDDGHVPAWEYLPAEAITPKVGLCLAFDTVSQQLEVSVTPQYICMRQENAPVAAGTLIPVVRITQDLIWEVPLYEASTLALGGTTDVSTDGLTLAKTGTKNTVEVVSFPVGTQAAGDFVRVRFVG